MGSEIDLTVAVEVAARAIWEHQPHRPAEAPEPAPWDEITPMQRYGLREAVMPAMVALADAGMLREVEHA